MKKLFCLLLVAGVFVTFISCKKNCNCTTYLNGVKVTTSNVELTSEYAKCSDMTAIVEEPGLGKTGLECK
jgi:hypothetical protein